MANNLRYLRRNSGLTLQELADKTGASASLLYKIENGERTLDKWKPKLAAALECHPDDLDTYDFGAAAGAQKVTLAGVVGAGAVVYPLELTQGQAHVAEVTRPTPISMRSANMLEVRGTGTLLEDFLLFYDDRLPGVPFEFIGKLCVLWLDDGTCVIRRPEKGTGPGRFTLPGLYPGDLSLKNMIVTYAARITHMVQR